jgi:hypothetical protein
MHSKELKKAASLLGKLGGAAKSIKKTKSSRANGLLGGRPKNLALPQEASLPENIKKESPKLIRRAGIKKEK